MVPECFPPHNPQQHIRCASHCGRASQCADPPIIWVSQTLQSCASTSQLTALVRWPFKYLGFAVAAIVVAAIAVILASGIGADKIAMFVTRRIYKGVREPEAHIYNLIIPVISTSLGCVLMGFGGEYSDLHWMVFMSAIFFIAFGALTINVVGAVYVVECFPGWPG